MQPVTKQDYYRLQAALQAEEQITGMYLADECVDRENVLCNGVTEHDADFWGRMYIAALSAAHDRRENT